MTGVMTTIVRYFLVTRYFLDMGQFSLSKESGSKSYSREHCSLRMWAKSITHSWALYPGENAATGTDIENRA